MFRPEEVENTINNYSEAVDRVTRRIIPERFVARLNNIVNFALGIALKVVDKIVEDIDSIATGSVAAGAIVITSGMLVGNPSIPAVGACFTILGGARLSGWLSK